jgi:hypothetical protein
MATRAWNVTYEAIPAGSDSLGDGDDRINDVKLDIRERAAPEHSWGTGEVVGSEGYHMQGSAVAYYDSATEPARMFVPGDGYPATGAGTVGEVLAAKHVGRLWAVGGHIFQWDGTDWQGLDITNFWASASTTGGWQTAVLATVTEMEADVSTDPLSANVVIPAVGYWYLDIVARITVHRLNSSGGNKLNLGIQVTEDPTGVPSDDPIWMYRWERPAATNSIYACTLTHRYPITTLDTDYDVRVIASAGSNSKYMIGAADSSLNGVTPEANISVVVKPYGQ